MKALKDIKKLHHVISLIAMLVFAHQTILKKYVVIFLCII